jgi:Na+-translocating ferredoxin:NAD+ oxidoreductase RNF subunit RnfB
MPSKDEILEQSEIATFLSCYHGAKSAIESAAELLQKQPDAISAVKKLLRAHAEKVIFVFFSYKKKDESTAKAVVQLLRESSAEKLRISYQADNTKDIVGQECAIGSTIKSVKQTGSSCCYPTPLKTGTGVSLKRGFSKLNVPPPTV